MNESDKRFLDQKLDLFKRYWQDEIRSAEEQLGFALHRQAEAQIRTIRFDMSERIEKAEQRYKQEMANASAMMAMPELASEMRQSAQRQLETTIQGYKVIAEQAIRSIQALAKS